MSIESVTIDQMVDEFDRQINLKTEYCPMIRHREIGLDPRGGYSFFVDEPGECLIMLRQRWNDCLTYIREANLIDPSKTVITKKYAILYSTDATVKRWFDLAVDVFDREDAEND